ncbi:hypothetical protein [Mesorhizobium sp. M1406]|uniref:hypothetical protein n=1 Tax=Mesorhizobium sp. M1406 TaxID=2957099 RepID=UPI00333D5ECF
MAKIGICAFCKRSTELCDSHVLPAFVFRWLRQRSGRGHIRSTENPNIRVQDGLKLRWLCRECESRFNRSETAFATNLFHPWLGGQLIVNYQDWLLNFCVSVSWRVLKYCKGINRDAVYTAEQENLVVMAEERWHRFLLDEVSHPGDFEQHLLIFDLIENTDISGLPNNINRYLTGAVQMDIVGSNRSLMTFAKLGRFCIFGLIQRGSSRWEGTKIHVRDGVIKPGKFVVPRGIADLLKEKAADSSKAFENLTANQQAKIDQNVVANADLFTRSEQFKAILRDREMFGHEAIISRHKKTDG